jgi:S1-C subfamily serine protease
MTTPLDFVCTDDIIGGNSGSPVVDRAGDFVGIIFDGNLESLPWDFAFDDQEGRAIAVDSAAILQALDQVFEAKALVGELITGEMKK